ncbi:MAG: hypothetical protein AAFR04_03080 [Pseudomonadota bacterium]
MGRIILVHGTFNSGDHQASTREAADWWQSGGQFDAELRHWIQADDGSVGVVPFVWDGANSENSRRKAGAQLAKQLDALKGEPHVLVGHSHGGSVIAHALEITGQLTPWITIGTPFIRSKLHRLTFNRLNLAGRLLYLPVATLILALVLALLFAQGFMNYSWLPDDEILANEGFFSWLFRAWHFGLALLLLVWALLRFDLLEFWRRCQRGGASLDGNWLGLWHHKDEAINALKAAQSAQVEIFSAERQRGLFYSVFLAAFLAVHFFLSVYTAVTFLFGADSLRDINVDYVLAAFQAALWSGGDAIGDWFVSLAKSSLPIVKTVGEALVGLTRLVQDAIPLMFYFADIGALAALLVGLPLWMLLAALLTYTTGGLLARRMNGAVAAQIMQNAYGFDITRETGTGALPYPRGAHAQIKLRPPLPETLSQELEHVSNRAVAAFAPRLRDVLAELSVDDNAHDTLAQVVSRIDRDVLIHTTYFTVPRMRKLIAYAICQSNGFSETAAFLADPDYRLVAGWYAEIISSTQRHPDDSRSLV